MGLPVTAVGSRISLVPQQEFRRDAVSRERVQAQARGRAAELALEQFESSLPGGQGSGKSHDIQKTAADLERISLAFNKKLQFVVDHQSHEVTVKVIDAATDKVIKVLPPEELQRLHNKIREAIGFLFDESV
ncbi:MAG: flagellar protein FlaG [Treponema sp.]|jgi:flagellar protein FlaG|nr:flagellar protein FlaG [Treponema sp.]MDR1287029.1 flagellar protein FlaG [Treponema sp.]